MTGRPKPMPASARGESCAVRCANLLAKAQRECRQRQFDAAERTLVQVLAVAPDDPVALRTLGMVVQRRGDHERAIACFRRVLAQWPDDPDLHTGLGISLCETGAAADGITHFRRACELAPRSASAWFNLGRIEQLEARSEDAVVTLQRALELDPDRLPARLLLAQAQADTGAIDAAVAGFREVLRRDPQNAEAWFGLSNLNTVHFDAADTACLAQAMARQTMPARAYELLGFTYAKALEYQGEYGHAFDVFRLANRSRRRRVSWNAAREHARIGAIRYAFGAAMPAPSNAARGREVIFIVSMPRSGSTLVEQMLAAHPDVAAANEIKDLAQVIDAESERRGAPFPEWIAAASAPDWQRLGAQYLTRTARWHAATPRFTDKSLLNWPRVGAALAMLPAARVIVVQRDPVEACLGCWRQCLSEARGFACDLDELADYCADFMRLTRFWCEQYPERVTKLAYEALLAHPEREIRRVLDFCELSFDPACLAFHDASRTALSGPSAAQVRQPLRRDTARSARYGDRLDGLRARLRDAGVLAP